jgi:Ca2+-binding RTX toxin-like protein
MASVTFSEGFTPDQLVCLLATMREAGVTVTEQIGEGPDTVTLADEAGDAVVITGQFELDAEGELHGTLTQIAILQASAVVVTVTGFNDLDAHAVVQGLEAALDSGGDGPGELHDLFELLGAHSIETEGGDDDDQVDGDDGNDDLGGGAGDDTINGGAGDDHLHGDHGDDDLCGDEGDDSLNGGSGDDTADYSQETGTDGVRASLMKHMAMDTWGTRDHFKSIENLVGSANDDVLTGDNKGNVVEGNDGSDVIKGLNGKDALDGGDGDDDLSGGNGKDDLNGGLGDDVLKGGNGKDVLNGGEGSDTLTGGMGRDTFVFSDPTSGPDTITDFRSHLDKIAIDFVPDDVENLGPDDFFLSTDLSGLAAGQAALIYDRATGVLTYDADGAGGNDAVDLVHFKPGTMLQAGDFDFIA